MKKILVCVIILIIDVGMMANVVFKIIDSEKKHKDSVSEAIKDVVVTDIPDSIMELLTINKGNVNVTVAKFLEDVVKRYNLNDSQKAKLYQILETEFPEVWNMIEKEEINEEPLTIKIARTQLGNVGGEPFWRWYGYSYRAEWCAMFVSWVGNIAGLIDEGKMPKFQGVRYGVSWFKENNRWKEKGSVPVSGDVVFFDWNVDGLADHVGFVERVDETTVYTIEGNANDVCKQKQYSINSPYLLGYGNTL